MVVTVMILTLLFRSTLDKVCIEFKNLLITQTYISSNKTSGRVGVCEGGIVGEGYFGEGGELHIIIAVK